MHLTRLYLFVITVYFTYIYGMKTCTNCKKSIFDGRSDKKFCSDKCRMDYHNHIDRGDEYRDKMSKRVVRYYLDRKKKDPESHILFRARDSARRKGYKFNLEHDDIFIPEYCPLLNIKLTYNDAWASPSIDRINPKLGYIKGNVWIISRKANMMKQDISIELLKIFAENLLKKLKGFLKD